MKIVLTATVTPQVTWDLHVIDVEQRRQQYIESLRRWVPTAARHGATLVLIENSGADLEQLARDAVGTVPSHLRLVNAPTPSAEDVERGKGAAEAAMLDQFAAEFHDGDAEPWYKATGRLYVRNFDAAIPARVPERAIIARIRVDFMHMDTRFVGATAGVWRSYFTGLGPSVNDREERFLERNINRRTLTAMGDGVELLRFRAAPDFYGRSGTHADRVYDSFPNRAKRVATNQLDRLLKGPLAGKQY